MNYNNLKAIIDANIKANNDGEITGVVLNSVLNSLVNSVGVGYQYMGVASPTSPGSPQNPDYRCFYIASTPGTYTYLGGLVVSDDELAILKWDNAWHKESIGHVTIEAVNPFKGLFQSVSALNTAYPNPSNGDYAYVKISSNPDTIHIYNGVSGSWSDTGLPVSSDIESIFTTNAKLMLLSTLAKVAWIDTNGQSYIDELQNALFGVVSVDSITAVFNPGTHVITTTNTLEDLRQYLVVTAEFSDGSSEVVNGYTLSGSMTAGTQTIVVTYMDVATTFSVNVVTDYSGDLSTWKQSTNGAISYADGELSLRCTSSSQVSGYSVWVADLRTILWSAVNGKNVKIRLKVNSLSNAAWGIGIYKNNTITSLSGSNVKKKDLGAASFVLADDGYYECEFQCDLANFNQGTLSPTSSSTFGVYCYSQSTSVAAIIYDVQIIEVTTP